jgi:hypothetical protein
MCSAVPPESSRHGCCSTAGYARGMVAEARFVLGQSLIAVAWSMIAFAHPMLRRLERDNEPVVLLYDTPEAMVVESGGRPSEVPIGE